jgi:hypothetical protein
LITGIQKYFDNQAELDAWCVQHNVMKQGMFLYFDSEDTALLFKLRWD